MIAERRLLRDVPPDHVDRVLALICGYFLSSADEPVPPTSPYIRDAQRWQGEVVWDWLSERRGWALSARSTVVNLGRSSGPLVSLSLACAAAQACAPTVSYHTPDTHRPKASSVANIKSQIKRNKQNEKRHQRNKAVKSELKTARAQVPRGRRGRRQGRRASRPAASPSRKLDKAVSKGVIHKNQAANRKSAIMKQAASL